MYERVIRRIEVYSEEQIFTLGTFEENDIVDIEEIIRRNFPSKKTSSEGIIITLKTAFYKDGNVISVPRIKVRDNFYPGPGISR